MPRLSAGVGAGPFRLTQNLGAVFGFGLALAPILVIYLVFRGVVTVVHSEFFMAVTVVVVPSWVIPRIIRKFTAP